MKFCRLIFILNIIFLVSFGQNAKKSFIVSEDLYLTEIKDSVYVVTHIFPGRCNSLFLLLKDKKGILIDTPNETSGTKSLLDWINNEYGEIDFVAVNTGFHNDNLGGNEYLRSKNIKIYGPGLTSKLINERKDELKNILLDMTSSNENKKYYNSFKEVNFLPPTDTFNIKDGLNLEFGGELFEVYFPGESHTIDNTVVYIKNKNILFGGCMIMSMGQNRPGFMAHANMEAWPLSILNVKERFSNTEIVVPGHGDWGDDLLLDHSIEIVNKWNEEHKNE